MPSGRISCVHCKGQFFWTSKEMPKECVICKAPFLTDHPMPLKGKVCQCPSDATDIYENRILDDGVKRCGLKATHFIDDHTVQIDKWWLCSTHATWMALHGVPVVDRKKVVGA